MNVETTIRGRGRYALVPPSFRVEFHIGLQKYTGELVAVSADKWEPGQPVAIVKDSWRGTIIDTGLSVNGILLSRDLSDCESYICLYMCHDPNLIVCAMESAK